MQTDNVKPKTNERNKMSVNKLITELKTASCFYDAISWLAQYESEWDDKVRTEYYGWIADETSYDTKIQIENAIEILSYSNQMNDEWAKDFFSYLSEILEEKNNAECICLFTLQLLDQKIHPSNIPNEDSVICGYLNSDRSTSPILVYQAPPKSFQSEKIEKAKIRRNRNLGAWNPISQLNSIVNYMFIPRENFGELAPTVFSYLPPTNVAIEDLRIAIAPISKDAWFEVEWDDECKQFRCQYSQAEINQKVNEYLCAVVGNAAEKNAHIVVFPEMAANENTVDHVRKYLLEHPKIKEKIILVVLGTNWRDGTNSGCILSGSGSEIISVKKRIPFSMFRKDSEGEDHEYYEYLLDTGGPLVMLDVERIGRFSWMICRDFLSDKIRNVSARMSCAFQIVSAYTDRLQEMLQRARNDAAEYGMITALSNHCINNNGITERGFVYVPYVDEIARCFIERTQSCCCKECVGKICFDKECYWICTISKALDCVFE